MASPWSPRSAFATASLEKPRRSRCRKSRRRVAGSGRGGIPLRMRMRRMADTSASGVISRRRSRTTSFAMPRAASSCSIRCRPRPLGAGGRPDVRGRRAAIVHQAFSDKRGNHRLRIVGGAATLEKLRLDLVRRVLAPRREGSIAMTRARAGVSGAGAAASPGRVMSEPSRGRPAGPTVRSPRLDGPGSRPAGASRGGQGPRR